MTIPAKCAHEPPKPPSTEPDKPTQRSEVHAAQTRTLVRDDVPERPDSRSKPVALAVNTDITPTRDHIKTPSPLARMNTPYTLKTLAPPVPVSGHRQTCH